VIYSTDALESLNARMRWATRARGHVPTEQAALQCLYLTIRSLDPTGKGAARWMNRWKPALNAFAITFEGRTFTSAHRSRQPRLHRSLDRPPGGLPDHVVEPATAWRALVRSGKAPSTRR